MSIDACLSHAPKIQIFSARTVWDRSRSRALEVVRSNQWRWGGAYVIKRKILASQRSVKSQVFSQRLSRTPKRPWRCALVFLALTTCDELSLLIFWAAPPALSIWSDKSLFCNWQGLSLLSKWRNGISAANLRWSQTNPENSNSCTWDQNLDQMLCLKLHWKTAPRNYFTFKLWEL